MHKTNAPGTGIGGRVAESWRAYTDKKQTPTSAHADALNSIQSAYQARLSGLTRDGRGTVADGLFKGLKLQQSGDKYDCELADKLEGRFERRIQDLLLRTRNKNFPGILCVGCVDGYYAMGTAVTFKPEVVHVIEPRLAGRARLMANLAVNSIATDIEVDATITSTEVGQIARIYERLLIILDEPTLAEIIVNAETIEFLSCSELIFETTGMQHTMPVDIIIGLLSSTHEISHVDEDPENFLWLCHLDDPSARELAALIWRGKRHPKSWLHAKPRNTAFSPSK